jgi:hypothetical protein
MGEGGIWWIVGVIMLPAIGLVIQWLRHSDQRRHHRLVRDDQQQHHRLVREEQARHHRRVVGLTGMVVTIGTVGLVWNQVKARRAVGPAEPQSADGLDAGSPGDASQTQSGEMQP